MEAKEIKKLIALAKKSGIIKLKVDGFEIEFSAEAMNEKQVRPVSMKIEEDSPVAPVKEITLDAINEYIYGNTESNSEVHFT